MKKEELKAITDRQQETIVTFKKKDGTRRIMKCTTNPNIMAGAKNFVAPKGDAKNTKAQNPNILTVWDLEKDAFRTIDINSLISVI